MATRIIGIDFGTSTTVVRVHNVGAENRIVPVAVNGQRSIPTIAFIQSDTKEMYYGYDAQAKIDSKVEGAILRNFKMDLISDNEDLRKQAEFLIEGFLHYVYIQYQSLNNAGAFDPADEVKVYVSHPAKWSSYARTFMKKSVEKAGFCNQTNIILKDEPTAAILAVMHEKNTELVQAGLLHEGHKHKAMMIDMGAGTTDIVLCTYVVVNGKLEIDDVFPYPSINAPGLCGGREIDSAILSEAERFVNSMQATPSALGTKTINKLSLGVKKWKEQTISSVLRRAIVLPEPDEIAEFRDTLSEFGVTILNENERFSISREYFETFTRDHWKQWADLLKGAFEEVKSTQYASLDCPKRPEDVELLIITGGHSQWYIVSEFLQGKPNFANIPAINFAKIQDKPSLLVQSNDPQETVAVGLCHLDEDIVSIMAASNDVSMSFTCEGKYLGTCELIKKGVPLPFEKRDFLIENTIKGNFIFRKALKIDYSIITDKVNTINKSRTVPSDYIISSLIKGLFAGLYLAIGGGFKIISSILSGDFSKLDGKLIDDIANTDYKAQLSPDIIVNEEGIIKVGGTITIDGEKLIIPEIEI